MWKEDRHRFANLNFKQWKGEGKGGEGGGTCFTVKQCMLTLRGEKLNYNSVAKEILKSPFWGVPEVQ